jgi:hypothetical protein
MPMSNKRRQKGMGSRLYLVNVLIFRNEHSERHDQVFGVFNGEHPEPPGES